MSDICLRFNLTCDQAVPAVASFRLVKFTFVFRLRKEDICQFQIWRDKILLSNYQNPESPDLEINTTTTPKIL